MAQMGFFDLSDRYASLDAKKDPLIEIDAVVPWEEFRPTLEGVWRKPESERKSRAGRRPWDAVVMFKKLVLSALYNLSDDQIEYLVRDRLSFMRFLGPGLGDRVPDAKTVRLYREALAQAGMVEALFKQFDHCPAGDCAAICREGAIWRGRATSRGAGRFSMRPSSRCHATTIPALRPRRSRTARSPRAGPTSPPGGYRRIPVPAAGKSTASPITATRTTSTWTASTSWSAVTLSAMPPCIPLVTLLRTALPVGGQSGGGPPADAG